MKLFIFSFTLISAAPKSGSLFEILSLIEHAIPEMQGKFNNYGCTGVGNMDSTQQSLGHPVDNIDKAINRWKHCVNCASDRYRVADYSSYDTRYLYHAELSYCGMYCYFWLFDFHLLSV